MVTNQSTLNDLLNQAIASTKDVNEGEIFIVKDLFRGFEWNRISRGNRTKLGSMYFSYAKNAGSIDIKALDKTPQNQQKYIKK